MNRRKCERYPLVSTTCEPWKPWALFKLTLNSTRWMTSPVKSMWYFRFPIKTKSTRLTGVAYPWNSIYEIIWHNHKRSRLWRVLPAVTARDIHFHQFIFQCSVTTVSILFFPCSVTTVSSVTNTRRVFFFSSVKNMSACYVFFFGCCVIFIHDWNLSEIMRLSQSSSYYYYVIIVNAKDT